MATKILQASSIFVDFEFANWSSSTKKEKGLSEDSNNRRDALINAVDFTRTIFWFLYRSNFKYSFWWLLLYLPSLRTCSCKLFASPVGMCLSMNPLGEKALVQYGHLKMLWIFVSSIFLIQRVRKPSGVLLILSFKLLTCCLCFFLFFSLFIYLLLFRH